MPRPEFRFTLVLEAAISPSEDPARVADAVAKVIGTRSGAVELGESSARLRTEDAGALTCIREKLRDRHVRSAARRQLLLNRRGNSTSMMLNRQAAAAGVLALCGSPDESVLGPIYATMESDRLDDVVDSLTAYEEG